MQWAFDPVQTIGILLGVGALVALALCGFRFPSIPRVDGYANEWARRKGLRK